MQLGRLRCALRQAILTLDRFGVAGLPDSPSAQAAVEGPPVAHGRRTMRLISTPRPTVAQIAERIAAESTSRPIAAVGRPDEEVAAPITEVPSQRTSEDPVQVSVPVATQLLLVTATRGHDV
jgi:hypothetical protein